MAENQPGRAEVIERGAAMIRELNLFSDLFMSTALRDRDACEYVLRKILQREDLRITKVNTQWRLPNLTSKDAILDVFAEAEGDGSLFNLEDQRGSTVAHAKRTRYYTAMIDKSSLEKGKEYDELPEVYVIYVSEKDIWKGGQAEYIVEQKFRGTETLYENGTHLIYVNAAVDDGSELAKLMRYFKTADPDDMSQGALSERVRYLKSEKGDSEMCEVSDWIYNQGRLAGEVEGRAEGRTEGRIEGKVEGMTEQARSTALELQTMGLREAEIARAVKFDLGTVRSWLAPVI